VAQPEVVVTGRRDQPGSPDPWWLLPFFYPQLPSAPPAALPELPPEPPAPLPPLTPRNPTPDEEVEDDVPIEEDFPEPGERIPGTDDFYAGVVEVTRPPIPPPKVIPFYPILQPEVPRFPYSLRGGGAPAPAPRPRRRAPPRRSPPPRSEYGKRGTSGCRIG
jgi:hypothetical protein